MIESRTIFSCDNLAVLRGMASESIDLIYLDPPFNSNHNYAAPLESEAVGGTFKDTWTLSDIDADWIGLIAEYFPALHSVIETAGLVNGDSNKAYMVYMAVRIMEMYRVLKSTGSLYFHCDPTMSHSIKLMLDSLFDKGGFISEIIWSYRWGGRTTKKWNRKHDVILMYVKSNSFIFNVNEVLEERTITEATKNRLKYKGALILNSKQGDKVLPADVWYIPTINAMAKERTGYPTQKPLELLRKIIKASSNEGDMVLDPFCGCATTCIAAEELKRQWIGIDIDPLAAELVKKRMEKELGLFGLGINNPHEAPPPVEKLSRNIKHILFHQQGGVCNGCNIAYPIHIFHQDDIVPRAKGGADTNSNLQLLCGFCNSLKGDRSMGYLVKEVKIRGIYNETTKNAK